jgi:hypothetical protein
MAIGWRMSNSSLRVFEADAAIPSSRPASSSSAALVHRDDTEIHRKAAVDTRLDDLRLSWNR